MKAGPELDALMATEVMGWKRDDMGMGGWQRIESEERGNWVWTGYRTPDAPTFFDEELRREMPEMWNIIGTEVWCPTTDIAAAMQVPQRVMDTWNPDDHDYAYDNAFVVEASRGGKRWDACFGGDDRDYYVYTWEYRAWADAPALAICLAALMVKGIVKLQSGWEDGVYHAEIVSVAALKAKGIDV